MLRRNSRLNRRSVILHVYALAGAATRKIAPSALVGIHAAKTDERAWKQFADQNPGVRRLTPDERNQGLWRFLMGPASIRH